MTTTHSSSPVMTIKEAADYLKINVMTAYRLANSGQLPAVRIGRSWRFHKPTLDAFLQTGGTPQPSLDGHKRNGYNGNNN